MVFLTSFKVVGAEEEVEAGLTDGEQHMVSADAPATLMGAKGGAKGGASNCSNPKSHSLPKLYNLLFKHTRIPNGYLTDTTDT